MSRRDRVVLHSDLNSFYASVECQEQPQLKGKNVAVVGDPEARHGIVLTATRQAKEFGVRTGDAIWQAKLKCPNLICIPARFELYLKYSRYMRDIYSRFTDRIENFGIDESWLDVTHSCAFGDGAQIADEIRRLAKLELGLTVSVGVSWNKIFAKLGSDMKKPDATTVISRDNVSKTAWQLPAEDLLLVGKKTKEKLYRMGINTIGDIANADVAYLRKKLNKWGEYLWVFAQGDDPSEVTANGEEALVKSVGNSTTCVRDLNTPEEVKMMVSVMAESVAARLREQGLKGRVVSLYIRDKELRHWNKQLNIKVPTYISTEIITAAMYLFKYYDFQLPIRSVGVKVSMLSSDSARQLDIFRNEDYRVRQEIEEATIDMIRLKYGHHSIKRALLLKDTTLTGISPKDYHTIHPVSYLK